LAAECEALGCLTPVKVETRGRKGETLRSLVIGGYKPDQVLSEGEQRALALADFLAEATLTPGTAGIILDDPVTSMDNQRKERIAVRLAKEAKTRQVIVFTHDIVFLQMLEEQVVKQGASFTGHWVQKS